MFLTEDSNSDSDIEVEETRTVAKEVLSDSDLKLNFFQSAKMLFYLARFARGHFFKDDLAWATFQRPGATIQNSGANFNQHSHLQSIGENSFCFAIVFQFLKDLLYKMIRGQFPLFYNSFSIS